MRLILFFSSFIIVSIIAVTITVFSNKIKLNLRIFFYKCASKVRRGMYALKYCVVMLKSLNNTNASNSILVESIFNQFCFFYDNTKIDIESSWEFPPEFFPNGKSDITSVYRWIKKTRIDNYNELNNIDYDYDKCVFIYWGKYFEGISYKINNGELRIIPIDYTESSRTAATYNTKVLKMRNDLSKIDTERCEWILNRRQFFGI